MKKKDALSPTMQAAFNHATRHGAGKLFRFPGGFWAIKDWAPVSGRPDVDWFGTTTIEAIVKRERGAYTDWQERRDGSRFPIEVTMRTDKQQ